MHSDAANNNSKNARQINCSFMANCAFSACAFSALTLLVDRLLL